MNKGVANFWRYAQVARQANARYLEALAQAQPKGKAIAELDRLCQPHRVDGKRYARFQPVSAEDCQIFAAVLDGKHALNGFRNKDMQARLYESPPTTPEETRRRSQRVCRKIAKLRGHGLVKKVPGARLYRPTERGTRLMAAALHCRNRVPRLCCAAQINLADHAIVAEQFIDRSAAPIMRRLVRRQGMTVVARQTFRIKCAQQVIVAFLFIEQIGNIRVNLSRL